MLLEQVNQRLEKFSESVASSKDVTLRREFEELKAQVAKIKDYKAEADSLRADLAGGRGSLPTADKVREVLSVSKTVEGMTVGLKLSPQTRERMQAQEKRWGAKTYRQVVTTCAELGLAQLEKIEP